MTSHNKRIMLLDNVYFFSFEMSDGDWHNDTLYKTACSISCLEIFKEKHTKTLNSYEKEQPLPTNSHYKNWQSLSIKSH